MEASSGRVVKRLVAPTTYSVLNEVTSIDVDTSSGGITIIKLQPINIGEVRKKVYVNDVSSNASVGNIIIQASGGNLINNAPSLVLDSNGIVVEIEIADRNRFIANLNTDEPSATNGHIIQDDSVSLPQRQKLNFIGATVTDDPINNQTDVEIISLLENMVYVAKNGNDATADGSIAKPFLTIQAGMDYAYLTYVVPANPQPTSPFTRPCVYVVAGTYDDGGLVLPPQICVMGDGYNNSIVIGDWAIDILWENLVPNDFRSTLSNIGVFGVVNFDFEAFNSNEGKIYANGVLFSNTVTITPKLINQVSNETQLNSCQFLNNLTLNGIKATITDCIVTADNLFTYNQSLSASANNTITTIGGSYKLILIASLDVLFPQVVCNFGHSIRDASVLIVNGQYSMINADISSIPKVDTGFDYLSNATDRQLNCENKVTLSNKPPLWLAKTQYYFYEEFDKGILPQGWATSLSGGTATYTQAYEQFAIGQAFLSSPRGVAVTRAGLGFGTTFNYILSLTNASNTYWSTTVRKNPTDVGFTQVGLSNSISIVLPASFGNTIAVIYDPNNVSGKNPTLLTNWLLVTQRRTASFTVYDTGVAPNNTWQEFCFRFLIQGGNRLTLEVNDVLTNTITNMVNVPINDVTGAGFGLSPIAYVGSIIGAVGVNQLRVSKFSLFRVWT